MAEQLSACARQLFEGVSGSNEQCAANAWLIQFQTRKEAWQAALELLENPVRDPQTQQILAAPELVAMQILRLKTQYEWAHINEAQQQVVRKTLLKLLETTCVTNAGLSSVCCRIACVTVADIIVKSCKTQTEWKSDVLRLVDAGIAVQRQQKGASILAEIYGAIPHQIQAVEKQWALQDMQAMLVTFQGYGEDVMTAVLWILTSIPVEKSNALRCLESWIVGCVPTHETFGLSASHLFPRGLLDVLFAIAFRDTEQGQLAAEIIAESFVCTPSEVSNMTEAVLYSSRRLLEAMPFLRGEIGLLTNEAMTKEQQTSVCRCMSRIACSLAIHHGRALFEHQISTTIAHFGSDKQMHFSIEFLEFLLACSSYDDIDVVQPTLEIWFFFLDNYSFQSKVKCQHLHATQNERVLSILSRLVSSLIDRCKYPQWFIQRQQLVSDDPDIEAITDLRREIADTLLSLFSKWPGGLGKPAGDYVSCVKEMCLLLSDSKDIAQIDALLFLLAYMVELFDAVSSDSEPEDDVHSIQKPEFCGMSVLLGILDCAANLPMHPLVINGVARYLRSLSTSHALQSNVYLRFSIIICQGLQYPSSFSLAAQSLLRCSTHLSNYTTVEERAPLVQELLRNCSTSQCNANQESEGDLLEVTFLLSSGASDTDFGALCVNVLSKYFMHVQSKNPVDVSKSIYLLGRALRGVQDHVHGFALVNQLWSGVSASLIQYKRDESCCQAGIHFFLSVIPHLQMENNTIETQILDLCLWWYGKTIAPDILTCCSNILNQHRGSHDFQGTAKQTFERLLSDFLNKLRDDIESSKRDESMSMETFLLQHDAANKMTPEVIQFMGLAREVVSSFPQNLLSHPHNGEPSLFWICLNLATRLLKVDHQMQGICDAACDFLVHAMRCQPEPILERLTMFCTEIVRVALSFLGPRSRHYHVRNIWDFLFKCLHAPEISCSIRGGFLIAVSTVVHEDGALCSCLPVETYQHMPGELRMRRQRHRFRQYFTLLGNIANASC